MCWEYFLHIYMSVHFLLDIVTNFFLIKELKDQKFSSDIDQRSCVTGLFIIDCISFTHPAVSALHAGCIREWKYDPYISLRNTGAWMWWYKWKKLYMLPQTAMSNPIHGTNLSVLIKTYWSLLVSNSRPCKLCLRFSIKYRFFSVSC